MKKNIENILKQKINKNTWKEYLFSEFVENIVEKIVPKESGLEHYIGLEHLDSGSLKIRRFGDTQSLIGDKIKIYKGDLIFAKRNAYLKRVAKAEFDAVASAHSMVLRAKPDIVLPEFLPFFLLSDVFWDKAIEISVGSLSPTINWRDLAKQKFLLPPKDEQAKLAKLLWAADNVVEKDLAVLEKLEIFFQSSRNSIFALNERYHKLNIKNDKHFKDEKFNKIIKKLMNGLYKSKDFHGKGIRLVNMGELFAYPIISNQEMSLLELNENEKKNYILDEGDLLFARRSLVIEGSGKCSIIDKHDSPMTFESSMIRVVLNKTEVNPKYIFHFLKSKEGLRRIRRIICFTTVAGIAGSDLVNIKVPYVSKKLQNKIIVFLDQFDERIDLCKSKLQSSRALLKSLINEIFS